MPSSEIQQFTMVEESMPLEQGVSSTARSEKNGPAAMGVVLFGQMELRER
ncbi:MAG: hypothetical protein Q7S68_04590 [Deltaproteobacteria bacterium]|nr:hypothetical protein [Deltaproteobacteria bacterium]